MIGQQHAMSGQISAVWNIFASVPTVAVLLISGELSGMLEDRNADQAGRILFLVGATIMAAVAVYAAWKPAERVRQHPQRTGVRRASAEGSQKAGRGIGQSTRLC